MKVLSKRTEVEYRAILKLAFGTDVPPFGPLDPYRAPTRTEMKWVRVRNPKHRDGTRAGRRATIREQQMVGVTTDSVASWPYQRRVVLVAAIRWAKGLRPGTPDPDVDKVPIEARPPHKEPRIPSEAELQTLDVRIRDPNFTMATRARPLSPAWRAVIDILLRLGLRLEETAMLPQSSIDRSIATGQLVVKRKGGKEQTIPSAHVTQALELVSKYITIFRNKKGGPSILAMALGPQRGHKGFTAGAATKRVSRLVKLFGKTVGIPWLHTHLLRHGFATRLSRDGASLQVIQRWLGHASVATTQLYVHPDAADLEKYVRK